MNSVICHFYFSKDIKNGHSFTECLLCVKDYMREFIHIIYFPEQFFIAEKTKTWRCEVTFAGSHSQKVAE